MSGNQGNKRRDAFAQQEQAMSEAAGSVFSTSDGPRGVSAEMHKEILDYFSQLEHMALSPVKAMNQKLLHKFKTTKADQDREMIGQQVAGRFEGMIDGPRRVTNTKEYEPVGLLLRVMEEIKEEMRKEIEEANTHWQEWLLSQSEARDHARNPLWTGRSYKYIPLENFRS